jgi:hypothetical protein
VIGTREERAPGEVIGTREERAPGEVIGTREERTRGKVIGTREERAPGGLPVEIEQPDRGEQQTDEEDDGAREPDGQGFTRRGEQQVVHVDVCPCLG